MAAPIALDSGSVGGGQITAPGLVARFAPIQGWTPTRTLSHPIWLPALLDSVVVAQTAVHTEYETLSAGQFSQAAQGGPGIGDLRTLPLNGLILAYDPAWITVSGQNPIRLRNSLMGVTRSRAPVHLLLTWNPYPTWPVADMDVTLRQTSLEIRPQELDTEYVSLQISEWRDPTVPRDSSRAPGGNSGRKVTLPATVKLKASDTLGSLAQEYYGGAADWRAIRQANGIPVRWGMTTPIVKLGGHFKVGANIKIPLPTTGSSAGSG